MDSLTIVAVVIYRMASIGCGFGFAYLGYRLFRGGESKAKNEGELSASYGTSQLILKEVGPGVWFAFFGTAITCFSIYRGLEVSVERSGVSATRASSSQVGELLKIDPELDLDGQPGRMKEILDSLSIGGKETLDGQQQKLLEIYLGKLKARITAKEGGVES